MSCQGDVKPTARGPNPKPLVSNEDNEFSPFDKILQDETIQDYLKYPSLRMHLTTVAKLLRDPKFANEMTIEGRKDIALKKIRGLRVGGREENELVEEFINRFLELSQNTTI